MKFNLKKNKIYFAYFLICCLQACYSLPKTQQEYKSFSKINTFFGPEDMVLDTIGTKERIIIACDERRQGKVAGKILAYDISKDTIYELKLFFKKNKLAFHPIGIDLYENHLFIVNHSSKKQAEILKCTLEGNNIFIDTVLKDKSIDFPNDIFALDSNEFYTTNYHYINGNVTHYKNDTFTIIDKGLKLPNGIIIVDNQLLVTTTLGNSLISYDIKNKYKKEKIAKIKGADNISYDSKNIILSSHPKFIRFFKHSKNENKSAPAIIYSIDLKTKTKKVIYSNNGEQISAASGALFYKNKLYITQVFDNFVLICNP
jgi:hypothetical protein